MNLFVGKSHQGNNSPVQSVFRLAGNDEDALTYALGYLLARDSDFCAKLLGNLGSTWSKELSDSYSIHLQEVTGQGYGRRDVVVEDDNMRVVFEAKVGGAEPTSEQLLKYADELKLWGPRKNRALVALTQVGLSESTEKDVRAMLYGEGIRFYKIQWHEVIELVLSHQPPGNSMITRHLFDEFIRYVRSDYQMGYYDAEILIQDVNKLNAQIFKECWVYVTRPEDKKAPLYFAPYFTRENETSGISLISRVIGVESVVFAQQETDEVSLTRSDEHHANWEKGKGMVRERARREGFYDEEVRLFYLDRPITILETPATKKTFNAICPSKRIPRQIPKGFTLGFDDLLKHVSAARHP